MQGHALLLLLGAALLLGGCAAMDQLEAARDLEIETPADLTSITDGSYPGSYEAGLVVVELTVAVADGRMTAIDLERHDNGKGDPAEAIIDTVLREQRLDVDCVSGATVSSKVILKSIEDALAGAPRG
jgi:uncharacterized protein with FMN-binding domain